MKNPVGIKCTVWEVEKIFSLLIRDIVVVIDVAVAVVAVVVNDAAKFVPIGL